MSYQEVVRDVLFFLSDTGLVQVQDAVSEMTLEPKV